MELLVLSRSQILKLVLPSLPLKNRFDLPQEWMDMIRILDTLDVEFLSLKIRHIRSSFTVRVDSFQEIM